MPVACGLLLSSRPLGTLQWSKGEIRIQSSGSSTQITTTSRCSGEIAEASVSKGITNLELPSIGWQLFILDSSQSDPIALPAFLDTYATRLLTEPLRAASNASAIHLADSDGSDALSSLRHPRSPGEGPYWHQRREYAGGYRQGRPPQGWRWGRPPQ